MYLNRMIFLAKTEKNLLSGKKITVLLVTHEALYATSHGLIQIWNTIKKL